MHIGRSIKYIREAKKITLGELAKKASISVPMISLIESEKRDPSFTTLKKIASVLDVPFDAFVALVANTPVTSDKPSDKIASALKALNEAEEKLGEYLEDISNERAKGVNS